MDGFDLTKCKDSEFPGASMADSKVRIVDHTDPASKCEGCGLPLLKHRGCVSYRCTQSRVEPLRGLQPSQEIFLAVGLADLVAGIAALTPSERANMRHHCAALANAKRALLGIDGEPSARVWDSLTQVVELLDRV